MSKASSQKKLLQSMQRFDHRARAAEVTYVLNFLKQYGYLPAGGSFPTIEKAIKHFQGRSNLKVDGIVGPKTMKSMHRSRCGMPDVVVPGSMAEKVRAYAKANLNRWKRFSLLYYMEAYVSGLPTTRQRSLYQAAWDSWSRICGIKAVRVTRRSQAQIIVGTGSGPRSDFDGAGGTLAWAYLPEGANFDGQLLMRFDLGETWLDDGSRANGILYRNVACHEIGHLIGLDHSRYSTALMAPYYNPAVNVPQRRDDVTNAQTLYGKTPAKDSAADQRHVSFDFDGKTLKNILVT